MLRPFRQGTSDSSPPASRARGWRALLAGLPAVMALAALLFALPAAAAAPSPVFRFYNTATGTHFYTISVSERDAVIARYPTFTYEGPTFWALTTPDATTRPVYRFFNVRTGTHFYTISETEKNFVIANYPTFIFEGAVYYAMPGATSTTTGLYRFYNTRTGAHFYTISTAERDYVVAHWPFFTLEGVVYYVMPTGNGIPVNPPVNVAPQATIVASASQIGVPGAVTLTVTATDADGVVMNVALFDNGNEVAAFSAPPYVYTYTATAAGDHMFTAVATDDKGATGTSSGVAVKAGSAAANVAPTATLIASLSTLTVGSPVTLTANAADSDGAVTKVDFYLGATKINTATAPVGAASFGPTYVYTPAAAGTYTFTAVATDDKGATATSKPANVTVNAAGNKPPTVSVGLSSSFVIVPGTVTLTASASDPDGTVTKVSFFQDGVKLVDIVPPATLTKTVTLTTAGTYNFTAQATDNLGAVTMSTQAPVAAQNPPVVAAADADIWRLLNQATFGATQPEAARAKAMGIPAWLDDQFAQPVSGYPDSKYNRIQLKTTPDCTTTMPDGKTSYPPSSPEAMCVRDHLTLAMLQRDFFTHAVSGADQLRQRVAWALSQIVVTSANEQDLSYAHVMSRYQSIMFEEAFGNFEALLNKVTVNPAMGNYLDAVNNDRPNGTRVPNENYAREIMQLFSIGLVELGADGTPLKDAQGNLIPTYDQDDIKEFARVFTGWTYADPTGVAPTKKNAPYYGAPMQPFPTTATSGHDTTAKTLLNGQQLLANQTIQADTQAAVHNVFMHPNTGPFVAKQLIQHLVTGNPTPAYVKRVADVFANNGSGVRGDLKAVVRAILTDTEARGATKADPTFGALREPVQVVTSLIRALSGFTDGAGLEGRTNPLGQRPFFSPTVFNYYQPDYTIPGTSTLAPEFTIHNSNTAVGRANLVYSLVYNGIGPDATIPGATGTKVNTVQFAPLANDPLALVNQVNAVLLGGALPAAARDLIVTAVNAIPVNANPAVTQWKTDRANMAVYLMASSYHFQVQH